MPNALNLLGRRFGKLLVVKQLPHLQNRTRWLCVCDCGEKRKILGKNLTKVTGRITCGCVHTKHGEHGTSEYWAYHLMKQRCLNPKVRAWKWYGGRGIKICERWLESFENFLADMGHKPSPKLTLDRYPNPDGNYEKSNCRWATWKQQGANKSKLKNVRHSAS